MKKIFLVTLLIPLFFAGCVDKETYMESKIVDFNSKITSVDKSIAQPGDVVTFKGTDLDKVYKIMLNTENTMVAYTATATELKMTVPAATPLGDVITVNLFFSGKGLAQRALKIISPPVIQAFSPGAGTPGTLITLLGRELYLAQQIWVGTVRAASFEVIDDRMVRFAMPAGSTGGVIKIVTATGGESLSSASLILGREILINDFDNPSTFYTSISPNGNISKTVTYPAEEFPRNKVCFLTIQDLATSWGGNVDFYFSGHPAADNAKVSLSIDIKASKAMNINIMVAKGSDVWGLTRPVTTSWQTIVIPFSTMGSGYGSTIPPSPVVAPFAELGVVKIQPPAQTASNNFGETFSIDNIKFIIAN